MTRKLFEYGRADVAVKLLTAADPHGFGKWQRDGATTLWEYWFDSRSHDHPMFGAVTTYLFEYILGIKQAEDSCGFDSITISPAYVDSIDYAKGHITTEKGIISVAYEKVNGKAALYLTLPEGIHARVRTPIGRVVDVDGPTNARFV